MDLYVAIKDCTIILEKIEYTFKKTSATSFESISVNIQGSVYDLYDFNYAAPAINVPVLGQQDLAKNAAIIQIGAVRGVDQVGKIFQVECIIDKTESPLKWKKVVIDGQAYYEVDTTSPYYIYKNY